MSKQVNMSGLHLTKKKKTLHKQAVDWIGPVDCSLPARKPPINEEFFRISGVRKDTKNITDPIHTSKDCQEQCL